MAARTGHCWGCAGDTGLSIEDRVLAHVTGEWEAISTSFAAEHEGCRRTIVDESGRPIGCGCSTCRRARSDPAPRFRFAHQSGARKVTPEFQKNRPIVLERDGWVCQICDIPIEREALPFEDRAPAVDHLVRVTEGGGDELENLRATHRWCNLRRENFFMGEDDLVAAAARERFA